MEKLIFVIAIIVCYFLGDYIYEHIKWWYLKKVYRKRYSSEAKEFMVIKTNSSKTFNILIDNAISNNYIILFTYNMFVSRTYFKAFLYRKS